MSLGFRRFVTYGGAFEGVKKARVLQLHTVPTLILDIADKVAIIATFG